MSTPPPAEAPAPPAEARVEKPEDSVNGGQDEIPPPTEAQEAHDSPSPSNSASEGEYSGSNGSGPDDAETANKNTNETQPPLPNEPLPGQDSTAPPLPNEPLPADPAAPPLPAEPVPEPEDDGWEFHWNPNDQSYWFYNRFTGVWQQENPRVPSGHDPATTTTTTTTTTATSSTNGKTMLSNPASVAGGYNPAIHGDYDENAWYAQNLRAAPPTTTTSFADPSYYQQEGGEYYATAGMFNRRTGAWQAPDQGPERYSEEAKARRQLRAFYDVDAAANDMHDGRSLKAERAGKKPTRAALKAFKERRRAKKEEKRRAWLRD